MKARRSLLAAAVAGALLAAFFAGRAVLRAERGDVGVGMRAPDFSAAALTPSGGQKTLRDYRGDVVLVNIWATWCAPCRVEMPSMQRLHEAYSRRGLRIVAVSIDDPGTEQLIRAFADTLGLTFEILHDSTGVIQRLYRTTGVPETALIARDGTIRRRVAGAELWDSPGNRALVERLLEEPGS